MIEIKMCNINANKILAKCFLLPVPLIGDGSFTEEFVEINSINLYQRYLIFHGEQFSKLFLYA